MMAKHLKITGRVQGVGYREWMRGRAIALGLDGWVRNRTDGSVEALIAGAAEKLEELLDACRQGPAFAAVHSVMAQDAKAPEQVGFEKLPTL